LFVKKGTPQEVVDVLAQIAKATMASDEAQTLMRETGARVYWQGMAEAQARIAVDRDKSDELDAIIAQ
jgi:tripartite-type tricarboxylate transporter receptor subunit TctC